MNKATIFWLQNILDNVPGYIFWKDKNSVFLGCNSQFAQSVGFKASDEIIGKTDYDLPWTKEESDSYIADDKAVMKDGKPRLNIEETQTLPCGKKITLLTNKVPLLDESGKNIIGVIGVYQDISELKNAQKKAEIAKRNEEELRKAAMIFAGSVAHDLTTPLTNMNLMANNVSNIFAELLKIEETAKAIKSTLSDIQLTYLEKFPQSLQTQLTELNEYIKDSLKALN